MADPLDFSGKVVLVTGSSRGIGAALTSAFAARGAVPIINYVEDSQGRNRSDAGSLAAKLNKPTVIQADVSNAQQIAAMFDQIRQSPGRLDILINNAGIIRDRSLKNMTVEDWNAVISVNLSGAFHCTQQAATLLSPGGRIVNIASVAAVLGIYGQANYASAKAGLIALTRVTATELASQQITVNAIAPGIIDTEMAQSIPEEHRTKLLNRIPLTRIGQPEDIVNAAMFLCSPMASYITGQTIHVNGGFHMP
jgi:3-oxoacyl-[acyl-carrier protein] reductase